MDDITGFCGFYIIVKKEAAFDILDNYISMKVSYILYLSQVYGIFSFIYLYESKTKKQEIGHKKKKVC